MVCQEEAEQHHQIERPALGFVLQRTMHPSRAPPTAAPGPPSDRQDFGAGMAGAPSLGSDLGLDYEYEVKRQRLLQGGSVAASGLLHPYHQGQSLQSNPQLPFSSPPAAPAPAPALQSDIAALANAYIAGASSALSTQQYGAPAPAPVVAGSYPYNGQHAMPSNPAPPSLNPYYVSSSGSGYTIASGAGERPNYLDSGAMCLSSASANPNDASIPGRSLNPLSSTAYSSSVHMQPFPGPSSSVAIASPHRTGSPLAMSGHLNHHTTGSPPTPPMPMMPFEQRSPHHSHSPPPSLFKGPGFSPFAGYSHPFPVVRIRGLPFNCTESDVYDFFGGLDVVDVLLTHKHGRFSGEAYCVFGLPMQVELSLHRNRKSMGQRYIEVFRSKKHEYYLAVAAEVSEQGKFATGDFATSLSLSKSIGDKEHLEHTGVLKLRGLPFSASRRDVIEFFKDFNLKDENIQFVVHSDGRASGEAFVEFDSPSLSKQAMVRDKMMLGSRYIELFPSSSEEVSRITGRHRK